MPYFESLLLENSIEEMEQNKDACFLLWLGWKDTLEEDRGGLEGRNWPGF